MEDKWWQRRRNWYYKVEVERGLFTNGTPRPNYAIIRKLLRNVGLQDMNCLDVGTMEAAIPILLKRAGAKNVVAYDRFSGRSDWLNEMSRVYKADFEFIGGMRLDDFPKELDNTKYGRTFDLVVFSGVLYHLINPLGYLALVRSLCKLGGLFVFENRVLQDSQPSLLFNSKGFHGLANTYFIATTGWTDYTLRMLGLRPLYALYTGKMHAAESFRLAVICTSESTPCPVDLEDNWITDKAHVAAFKKELLVDWDALLKSESKIKFTPYDNKCIRIGERESLYSALERHSGPYNPTEGEMILTLDSTI